LSSNVVNRSEPVRKDHEAHASLLSMKRMEANLRKPRAFRLRFSKSLARRRQRPSQARLCSGRILARASRNFGPDTLNPHRVSEEMASGRTGLSSVRRPAKLRRPQGFRRAPGVFMEMRVDRLRQGSVPRALTGSIYMDGRPHSGV
jgi:hypothetical protein